MSAEEQLKAARNAIRFLYGFIFFCMAALFAFVSIGTSSEKAKGLAFLSAIVIMTLGAIRIAVYCRRFEQEIVYQAFAGGWFFRVIAIAGFVGILLRILSLLFQLGD